MLDPLPNVDEFAGMISERDNRLTPNPEIPFRILNIHSQNHINTSFNVIYLPDGRFVVHFKQQRNSDKITCSTAQRAAKKCVELIEKYYGDKPGEITPLYITKKLEPVSDVMSYRTC